MFQVYTPFRRAALEQLRNRKPHCDAAPELTSTPVTPPPLPDWQPPAGEIDSHWWPVGEEAAHRRLHDFLDTRIDRYRTDRDIPAVDGTSRLSPYLAIGAISVRRCVEAALRHNHGEWDSGNAGITTWMSELLWREFYLHVLAAFPRVSRNQPFRAETDAYRVAGIAPMISRAGVKAVPDSRWSTPRCASCSRPAGCTTACAC